jgi:SAM-dependent methyltransferase
MFFLRKSSLERLPVAMSGVRMGERALQLGVDDPSLVGAIAAKVGLSGHAAVAVRNESEAASARVAGETAGVLIEVQMQSGPTLPFESDSFDVIVLHASPRQASQVAEAERPLVLKEAHRVLRAGGRLVVVEGGSGSRAISFLRSTSAFSDPATVIQTLNTAGFRAARILAEQEGYRFSEGLK